MVIDLLAGVLGAFDTEVTKHDFYKCHFHFPRRLLDFTTELKVGDTN